MLFVSFSVLSVIDCVFEHFQPKMKPYCVLLVMDDVVLVLLINGRGH